MAEMVGAQGGAENEKEGRSAAKTPKTRTQRSKSSRARLWQWKHDMILTVARNALEPSAHECD
eukprot:186111-Amphidinium_carterae.1